MLDENQNHQLITILIFVQTRGRTSTSTCAIINVSRYDHTRSHCLRYGFSIITEQRTAAHSSYSTPFSQRFTDTESPFYGRSVAEKSIFYPVEIWR